MISTNDKPQTSILFVEDNADLRQNAALVLGIEGYEVRVARDGQEALDLLERGYKPHLIVSDIMMPRMDGYEFFEAVRQKNHLKGIPFIFLTARGSRTDISFAKSLGVDDYLIKPFEPEEFLIAIENKLRRTAEIRASADQSVEDARRRLVQLLSHELRTPLTYVTGGFGLLAEELEGQQTGSFSEDMRTSLDLIRNGTERLNRLAEQMVLYSQLTSGFVATQIKTQGEYVNLSLLLSDTQAVLKHLIQERHAVFEIVAPEIDPPEVWGIRSMLVTALSEVVRNALQYSPSGSMVQIVVSRDAQFGVLTVRDQGQGIKPEDQESIWNILVQSDRDRHEQQGVGMGLAIVKGIITSHGGEVTLTSVPGQGTQVTLRLPLVTVEDSGT